MNITHATTVTIPVADQDRARTFYVDVLGFDVVVDRQMGPMRWLQVAPKGAQTAFTLAAGQEFTPGSAQGIILESTDLDGDCSALGSAGVTVDGPTDLPWGRQAVVSDPDGNGFVLAAPAASHS